MNQISTQQANETAIRAYDTNARDMIEAISNEDNASNKYTVNKSVSQSGGTTNRLSGTTTGSDSLIDRVTSVIRTHPIRSLVTSAVLGATCALFIRGKR